MTEDTCVLKQEIVNFHQKLYTDDWGWHPRLDGVSFKSLIQEERNLLEQPFLEEVVTAVRSLKGDNAFTLAFFQ